MAIVKLRINGQEIEVEQGSTILKAANRAGIYIPTLCYHPYLPLEEACRICVVEEVRGGWSSLVAACVYPVRDGMVIETDSEMVTQARRAIIDLLLSNHPNDCMTCYAAGDCELQDVAFRYNVKKTEYQGEQWKYPSDSDPNSYLYIDMNKCILCRRCVRACHEVQGADIWTKKGRGFHQRITTAFDTSLEEAGCEFCGHCADFCPVDAIGFRSGRGCIRSWQLETKSTICLQCACGCRARYETSNGKLVRVRGDFESPASGGALCNRGRYNFDFINSPNRLTAASVRNGGVLEPASVEDAVKAAAAGLKRIGKESGGAALGIVCGGMLTNEEYYLAQKLARGALGTNNVDNVAGPWQQAAYRGLKAAFGTGPEPNDLEGIAGAKSVLVLGSNTMERQAIAALRARKAARNGAALIVAHPGYVPLKKSAGLTLQIVEGSEESLVLGLIKVVLEENLSAPRAVPGKAVNDIAQRAKSASMAEICEKTGLGEDSIREAARLYAKNRPAVLVYGIEPKSSPTSKDFYAACGLLQQLVNEESAEKTVFVLGAAGNAEGAASFGAVPGYLPGYREAGSAEAQKRAAGVWGVQLPDKSGLGWPEMIEAAEKGAIKGLYLVGADPFALGLPEERVKSALSRLEFLVVQDCVRTEACEQASVVLPASTFVEKDGTAVNCEQRIQALTRVVAAPGAARSDFGWLNSIIGEINPKLKLRDSKSAFGEAARINPALEGLCVADVPVEGLRPVKPGPEAVPAEKPRQEGKKKPSKAAA